MMAAIGVREYHRIKEIKGPLLVVEGVSVYKEKSYIFPIEKNPYFKYNFTPKNKLG
jgi:hypothetical protein